ncbi:MAG: Rrf2 family transcriptional regulator [Planctomycetota bacterium]|nr:Rrf2 family transcriptional regulator [Planctomycetota bacterium]
MLSNTAEYALRAAVHLAKHPESHCSAAEVAKVTLVPPSYVSKVLLDLVRGGITSSQRGPNGGFLLTRAPEKISLLEVINAVDPIVRIKTCPLGIASHGANLCQLHSRMDQAAEGVERCFAGATIADMAQASTDGSRCLFPAGPA